MALLEIRMIDETGKVVPTMEDQSTPTLPYALTPGSLVLTDYCFNERGPWVKPEQLLQEEDVAAVVFSRRGQIESMVVGGRKVHNEEEMYNLFYDFHGTVFTRYNGQKGKELFLFYLSPEIKRRIRPWKKSSRS